MIGILPAAGKATRLLGLPKMLLPVSEKETLIRRMVRQMEHAQARPIHFLTTALNAPLLSRYITDESVWHWAVATQTMAETLLTVGEMELQSARAHSVIMGMPDTYIENDDAFVKIGQQLDTGVDLVIGLFETRPEQRSGLGLWDWITEKLFDKPTIDELTVLGLHSAWGIVGWQPGFWKYIQPEMPHIGFAMQAAIDDQLPFSVCSIEGGYWDCGTLPEYTHLLKTLGEKNHG